MGRFLISQLQKPKCEIGNRSVSHFSFAEIEMGNEKWVWFPFSILSCANEKWEMGCFTYFLFRILPLANWINGISLDFFSIFIFPFLIGKTCNGKWEMGRILISHLQKSKWEMGNRSISHFLFWVAQMRNGKWVALPISYFASVK